MKKKLTISIIGILSILTFNTFCFSQNTQIPNGNFENWTDTANADNWNSNNINLYLTQINFVQRTSDANSGYYAAKIETKNTLITDFSGIFTLGSYNILYGAYGGVDINVKPLKLEGYYKYYPEAGDTMAIFILMTKWNTLTSNRDTLFYGYKVSSSLTSNYTSFEIPITYTPSTATPDTFNIILASSAGLAPQVGSALYIDDLKLTYADDGINESNQSEIFSVFPNPSSGIVSILLKNNKENNIIKIYNYLGEEIFKTNTSLPNLNINLSQYSNGMYFIEVNDNSSVKQIQKLIISK